MRFHSFTLMPYADLDLSYTEKHSSAWVTLPNSYYDPIKGAELYNRYIDELVYADELGFDGVCVNEHHQNAYGMMPNPGVIAGALARQTKRAKIAVLGRALPLLEYPLSVAEEFAMLDNISGGRLIAGFVRGLGAEYHSTGINPAESHGRFHEAHDLIVRAWTETGPFPFHGKYFDLKYVNTWPRTFQRPHPPIWIPSSGSRETIEWASHPSRKYTYLQVFSPVDALARFAAMYKEAAQNYGYEASADQIGWAVPIYVAETDDKARSEAKLHIENFFNKFVRIPPQMLLPPGYTTVDSMLRFMKVQTPMMSSEPVSIDTLMKAGMLLCGSTETVTRQLQRYRDTIGFAELLAMFQFATLPADLTRRNMEMFASEVMPRLR
jgi:alkanesulfonate monooxygenase SsuD/methylene tetrahydromethanopterin reductase-like flavin-dependent oxidoreductase (luciferase family)